MALGYKERLPCTQVVGAGRAGFDPAWLHHLPSLKEASGSRAQARYAETFVQPEQMVTVKQQ